jgi:hypothetical protein
MTNVRKSVMNVAGPMMVTSRLIRPWSGQRETLPNSNIDAQGATLDRVRMTTKRRAMFRVWLVFARLLLALGAVLLVPGTDGCVASSHVPPDRSASTEELGPSYFLAILDKESVRGVERRLYVAPPNLMTPLLGGIAKGSADCLDVYDRMRMGLLDATAGYLDDALARALAVEPLRLLSYFRDHPTIAAAQICGLAPPTDGVTAFVLEPRELLDLERREQRLEALSAPEVEPQRVACLDATRATLRREVRIYFVSYGAEDAKSRGERPLNEVEHRELEAAVSPARNDASLRARGDGSFPDGPFRVKQVPRGVLDLCRLPKDVANPEGPWEFSDFITDDRPRSRLLSACRLATNVWDITCQHGGFSTKIQHVRARLRGPTWAPERNDRVLLRAADPAAADAIWPDCRKLGLPEESPAGS